MKSLAQHRLTTPAATPATRTLTACVVDAKPGDYAQWREAAAACGVRLEVCSTAAAALRAARAGRVDLWVVNVDIPEISGFELCAMLKSQSAAPVYLVTDEYSADQERQAWAARASLFACKTQHAELFEQWIDSQTTLNTEH